jgi:pilus assembly protein Flp/PilA
VRRRFLLIEDRRTGVKSIRRMSRRCDESGATAVEYGLLVALIAGAIIGTVILLGDPVMGLYASVEWW